MARQHGVFRTAKILRLEYGKLKRMAEAANPSPQPTAPTAFLEVMPEGIGAPDCLIELEGPRGKMRIQWKATVPPDWTSLLRAWRETQG